jgi:hypothetical protein
MSSNIALLALFRQNNNIILKVEFFNNFLWLYFFFYQYLEKMWKKNNLFCDHQAKEGCPGAPISAPPGSFFVKSPP